eukprot:scaffold1549_cov350-Prasinococcus_capsulatus_cf.AAC.22
MYRRDPSSLNALHEVPAPSSSSAAAAAAAAECPHASERPCACGGRRGHAALGTHPPVRPAVPSTHARTHARVHPSGPPNASLRHPPPSSGTSFHAVRPSIHPFLPRIRPHVGASHTRQRRKRQYSRCLSEGPFAGGAAPALALAKTRLFSRRRRVRTGARPCAPQRGGGIPLTLTSRERAGWNGMRAAPRGWGSAYEARTCGACDAAAVARAAQRDADRGVRSLARRWLVLRVAQPQPRWSLAVPAYTAHAAVVAASARHNSIAKCQERLGGYKKFTCRPQQATLGGALPTAALMCIALVGMHAFLGHSAGVIHVRR